MVFNTVFKTISVMSRWPVHLSILSWSSYKQYSAQYSFQAIGCYPTLPLWKLRLTEEGHFVYLNIWRSMLKRRLPSSNALMVASVPCWANDKGMVHTHVHGDRIGRHHGPLKNPPRATDKNLTFLQTTQTYIRLLITCSFTFDMHILTASSHLLLKFSV